MLPSEFVSSSLIYNCSTIREVTVTVSESD
jgi:hypothetical protein